MRDDNVSLTSRERLIYSVAIISGIIMLALSIYIEDSDTSSALLAAAIASLTSTVMDMLYNLRDKRQRVEDREQFEIDREEDREEAEKIYNMQYNHNLELHDSEAIQRFCSDTKYDLHPSMLINKDAFEKFVANISNYYADKDINHNKLSVYNTIRYVFVTEYLLYDKELNKLYINLYMYNKRSDVAIMKEVLHPVINLFYYLRSEEYKTKVGISIQEELLRSVLEEINNYNKELYVDFYNLKDQEPINEQSSEYKEFETMLPNQWKTKDNINNIYLLANDIEDELEIIKVGKIRSLPPLVYKYTNDLSQIKI